MDDSVRWEERDIFAQSRGQGLAFMNLFNSPRPGAGGGVLRLLGGVGGLHTSPKSRSQQTSTGSARGEGQQVRLYSSGSVQAEQVQKSSSGNLTKKLCLGSYPQHCGEG